MHRRTCKRCCSHTHKRAHTHVFYISIATSPIFYPIFPFLLSFLLLFALFSDCLYSLWVKIYFSIVSTCSRWPNCRIPDSGPTFQANSWRARCVSVLFGCFFFWIFFVLYSRKLTKRQKAGRLRLLSAVSFHAVRFHSAGNRSSISGRSDCRTIFLVEELHGTTLFVLVQFIDSFNWFILK